MTAVEVFTLLAAALLATIAAGHGQISAASAWLATVDVSFVLLAMRTRAVAATGCKRQRWMAASRR